MSKNIPNPGPKPNLKWLPIKELIIDRNYQRDMDSAHVQRIMEKFQWRFFQAITVTPVKGGYSVIDGQHRVGAARNIQGIDKVPCLVLEEISVEEQARAFVTMNKTQKRVTPLDMFWAGVAAEEEEYMILDDIFNKSGVRVYSSMGGSLPPKTTTAVNTVRKLYRRFGRTSIEAALKIIVTAWEDERDALTACNIEAVESFIRLEEVSPDKMVLALRKWRPKDLIAKARLLAYEKRIVTREAIYDLLMRTK